ncbi:MAG: dioxygenase [Rhodospirillales bacterium]|nr:dioxygenase [Rhodospirillales bacterium]
MTKTFPTLFVSHGAPTLAIDEGPTARFLEDLGGKLGRPKSVLCVSAHWETESPVVGGAPEPETIHDFCGFNEELYEVTYAARGSTMLANRVEEMLVKEGIKCGVDRNRGLDHGAWVPLSLMFPEANIGVTQLSIQPNRTPAQHLAMGRALAPLGEEGVLVMGSGGAVHNLDHFQPGASDVPEWALQFDDWLADVVERGDADELVTRWTSDAAGTMAYPRDEHLLPLPVAFGAAGEGARAKVLNRGFEDGALSMAAYLFEGSDSRH